MQKVAINSTNGHYATKSKNLNTPNFKISFKKLFPTTFLSSCVSAGLHPKEGRADVAAGSLHQHRHRPLPLRPPPAQHLGAHPAPPGDPTWFLHLTISPKYLHIAANEASAKFSQSRIHI